MKQSSNPRRDHRFASDNFVLLSDVLGFDLTGGGPGLPTYTFSGTAPTVVYRGGSTEHGIVNAYTREYVFGTAYRYYGIRTSQISIRSDVKRSSRSAAATWR